MASRSGEPENRRRDGSAPRRTPACTSPSGTTVRMEAGRARAREASRPACVFRGRGKSIDPMRSVDQREGRERSELRSPFIVSMSFRSAIPGPGCSPAAPASASPTGLILPRRSAEGQHRIRDPATATAVDKFGLLMEGAKVQRAPTNPEFVRLAPLPAVSPGTIGLDAGRARRWGRAARAN